MTRSSVSFALTGSGGAGVMTAGQMLLEAAARAGWYGSMARSLGPQIRGGESAALLRLSVAPVRAMDDGYALLLALDWGNIDRFADELPMAPGSLILSDPADGPVPDRLTASGAGAVPLALKATAKTVPGGRVNMVALGVLAAMLGLPEAAVARVLGEGLGRKGAAALEAATAAVAAGRALVEDAASGLDGTLALAPPRPGPEAADGGDPAAAGAGRWSITGNEAVGYGALAGGVRFVAAYPITPATEVLEYLAPALPALNGRLIQAEDELASINMCLGASFGGVPSLTATSGPGLALMTESLGLAVAAEVPVVVVNVQRGGPSTGIPTKSEQADLDIALHGLHGDAPHLVTAPLSIADCPGTTAWTVSLAEALQAPAILLSDQSMGQARAVIDPPATPAAVPGADRLTAPARPDARLGADGHGEAPPYHRYALSETGVSPMALPGTRGTVYTADGLEHAPAGTPSTRAADHANQLAKRRRKLEGHHYGDAWALVDGPGDAPLALVTWGSVTGAVREAAERLAADGLPVRVVALRLLMPAQPDRLADALAGIPAVLVVEQSHGGQFHRYLRAYYDLPARVGLVNRPGPLALRPGEIAGAARRLAAMPQGEPPPAPGRALEMLVP